MTEKIIVYLKIIENADTVRYNSKHMKKYAQNLKSYLNCLHDHNDDERKTKVS